MPRYRFSMDGGKTFIYTDKTPSEYLKELQTTTNTLTPINLDQSRVNQSSAFQIPGFPMFDSFTGATIYPTSSGTAPANFGLTYPTNSVHSGLKFDFPNTLTPFETNPASLVPTVAGFAPTAQSIGYLDNALRSSVISYQDSGIPKDAERTIHRSQVLQQLDVPMSTSIENHFAYLQQHHPDLVPTLLDFLSPEEFIRLQASSLTRESALQPSGIQDLGAKKDPNQNLPLYLQTSAFSHQHNDQLIPDFFQKMMTDFQLQGVPTSARGPPHDPLVPPLTLPTAPYAVPPIPNLAKSSKFGKVFSAEQLQILETRFQKDTDICRREKIQLSNAFNVTVVQIEGWFSRRRQKEKKERHAEFYKKFHPGY